MTRMKYLFLLCMMPLALATLNSTQPMPFDGVLFTDSGQNLGNEWSNDVTLGDLDGDVDLDAFVVNSTPHSQVWINQGGEQGGTAGIYQDSGQMLGTVSGRSVALGDLDGDLDLDAFVILGFGTDSFQVWINQGGAQGGTAGIFQRNSFTINDNLGTNIVLGDVDGDTDLDAYIPRIFAADQLYLNDGTGLFTNSGQNLEADDSSGAGLADLDGDTDLDIFVAVQSGANTVWLNQGGLQGGTEGVFLDSGQTLGTGQSINLALGDLDNDNDIDAFVANAAENIVWINQGGTQGGTPGTFLFNGQLLGFSGSWDVQLADFDDDNDLDAFVAEFGPNTVWVNQGGDQGGTIGQFADSGLLLDNNTSQGVALGDVDGDMDDDAFVVNSGPAPNKLYLNGSGSTPPPVNPEGWQIQVVETRGDTGQSPSIALDSNGYPHIAHITHVDHPNGSSERLYHLYWDGIRWHNELVAAAATMGQEISLAIDSNDNPHIAFAANQGGLELIHAYWDGSAWQMQVIVSSGLGVLPPQVSLALDSNNNPHVVYTVVDPVEAFRYAAWNGTVWQIQTIEVVDFSFGTFSSLALDSNNHPHIAYLHEANDDLKYAHYNGSSWQINIVDSSSHFSIFDRFFDLELVGNAPVIAYYVDFGGFLNYAQWDGNNWQTQTIITASFPDSLGGELSLAIDSADNPHVSYAYSISVQESLRYVYWDGGQWQNEILDNSNKLGEFNAIALDSNDNPHIAYYDQTFQDLRYITWAPDWQIRTVPDPGAITAVAIQVQNRIPYLGYHNLSNGLVNLSQWDDNWQRSTADFVSSPVPQLSLVNSQNFQHLSFYDADTQDLRYGRHNEFGWEMQTVDSTGDVGRYNQLLLGGNSDGNVRIAYWDETNRRIKLAVTDPLTGVFQLYTNTVGPSLPAGSGPLSATLLADGNIGVAYYDGLNTGLRLATWQAATGTWSDEGVESLGGDIGRLNSLQTDDLCRCPVVAYYDETNDAIKYAYRDSIGWHFEVVKGKAGGVTSLSLELGFGSWQNPRLVYTTANTAHFAIKESGVWELGTMADGLSNAQAAALTLDVRPHMAYSDVLDGLQYLFRTATLDVDTSVPGLPASIPSSYNPLTPCPAIIDFFIERDFAPAQPRFLLPMNEEPLLDDAAVYQDMTAVFNTTTGGQYYIDLYFAHVAEMGQIGLDDPQLLWDAYGTLQNFLPGLEGLVTGHGAEFVVTQEMVDDALDIWTRIAAAANPTLANVINNELAQSNNLQDFVGMTFDEWAIALGVNPPGDNIYLPLLAR